MQTRGFEIITKYNNSDIKLPERKTEHSAGYDLESAENVIVKPNELALVPTGLKAYMQQGEYLGLHIRSSIAIKKRLVLINSQGIIDKDYYNNEDNEGHLLVALLNTSNSEVEIKKGERIAQAIFYSFLTTDQDKHGGKRKGGIGSTNNQ